MSKVRFDSCIKLAFGHSCVKFAAPNVRRATSADLLADLERALAQRLGLAELVALGVQHGEVVERGGDGRVVPAQRLLADRERVVEQAGRLLEPVLVAVHERQDVEHGRHVRVVVARRLLQVLQRLPAQRHRHLVPPLTSHCYLLDAIRQYKVSYQFENVESLFFI